MKTLLKFIKKIEKINNFIAIAVGYLIPLMAILVFLIAVIRYIFNQGWVWSQELSIYLHASIFILGIAYTMQKDAHVRVDIFYRKMTLQAKAWVNLMGSLFLALPFSFLIFYHGIPYVLESWFNLEASRQADGLPLVFLFKTLIIVLAFFISLQSLSLATRSFLIIFTKKCKLTEKKKLA